VHLLHVVIIDFETVRLFLHNRVLLDEDRVTMALWVLILRSEDMHSRLVSAGYSRMVGSFST